MKYHAVQMAQAHVCLHSGNVMVSNIVRMVPMKQIALMLAKITNFSAIYNAAASLKFGNVTEKSIAWVKLMNILKNKLRFLRKYFISEGEDERLCDCPLDSFRCHTGGGCIPLKYVCDGNPHCPDFSDEWKCFNIENMNIVLTNKSDESIAANDESQVHKILNIKKSNGQHLMLCASQWNHNYSNQVCSKLGFGTAERWSAIYLAEPETNSTFFRLRDSLDNNILSNLYEVDSCEDGVIALQCTEFECGKFLELETFKGQTPNSTNFPSLALAVSETVRCTATIGKINSPAFSVNI